MLVIMFKWVFIIDVLIYVCAYITIASYSLLCSYAIMVGLHLHKTS